MPVAGCWICVTAAGAGMSPLGASAGGIWGPFLTVTRCLLFLTGFYFLVVSKWFWCVSPWLGMVALSHCHCLHAAAPQLLLGHVAVDLGRPGGSRPLAQDITVE